MGISWTAHSPLETEPTETAKVSDHQDQEVSDKSNVPNNVEVGKVAEMDQQVSYESNAPSIAEEGELEEVEEDEEEGECGFCLFMKGGGCKESFIAWEKCVEEAEKNKEDVVEKCFEVTSQLKKCMDAHADYYEPILNAEKAAEEEARKELERESGASNGEKQENK